MKQFYETYNQLCLPDKALLQQKMQDVIEQDSSSTI